MKTEMRLITPEIAKNILVNNTKNRAVSKPRVAYYKEQMLNGKWKDSSPEPLMLDTCGELINGQHRLLALIQANKSYVFLIVSDVDANYMNIIDTGGPRSASDVLSLHKIPNYSSIATMISKYNMLISGWAIHTTGGNANKKLGYNNEDILNIYYASADLWQEIHKESRNNDLKINTNSFNAGFMSFLILEKGYEKSKVFDFFKQLTTGENFTNNTIRQLREYLLKEGRVPNFVVSGKERVWLVAKAFNNFIKNKEIKNLKYKEDQEISW